MANVDQPGPDPDFRAEETEKTIGEVVEDALMRHSDRVIITTPEGLPDYYGYDTQVPKWKDSNRPITNTLDGVNPDSQSLMWRTSEGGTVMLTRVSDGKTREGQYVVSKFAPEVGGYARKLESRTHTTASEPTVVNQEGNPFSYEEVISVGEPMPAQEAYELSREWENAVDSKLDQLERAVAAAKQRVEENDETVIEKKRLEKQMRLASDGEIPMTPQEFRELRTAWSAIQEKANRVTKSAEDEARQLFEQEYAEKRRTVAEGQSDSVE